MLQKIFICDAEFPSVWSNNKLSKYLSRYESRYLRRLLTMLTRLFHVLGQWFLTFFACVIDVEV